MQAQRKAIEEVDELNFRNDKTIKGQFEEGEYVVMSCNVNKHNKHEVVQQRALLITNKYIYNIAANAITYALSFLISNASIKRKIPISSVAGLTISTYQLSDQFIIHVSKEYDYRFSAVGKKRECIVVAICKMYRLLKGSKIPFYFEEEPDLGFYQTTDDDIKAHINKTPKDVPFMLSDEDLQQRGLEYFLKNKKNLVKDDSSIQTSTNKQQPRRAQTFSPDAYPVGQGYPGIVQTQGYSPNIQNPQFSHGTQYQPQPLTQPQLNFQDNVPKYQPQGAFGGSVIDLPPQTTIATTEVPYKARIVEPSSSTSVKLGFESLFKNQESNGNANQYSSPQVVNRNASQYPGHHGGNGNISQYPNPQVNANYQPSLYTPSKPQPSNVVPMMGYPQANNMYQPKPAVYNPSTTNFGAIPQTNSVYMQKPF